MTTFVSFVGVDIASASFMASVGTQPWKVTVKPTKFENDENGFVSFLGWLQEHNLKTESTVVCMEATGVYSEGLAYFLYASGYSVAVEPPLNIQRKFPVNASKTDELDCQYIAEYACRYADKLSLWKPRAEILEQVKLLLTTRQHFSVQLTGHKNALHAIHRKKVSSELAKHSHQNMIEQITKSIKEIDKEIRRLIESDPTFKQTLLLLMTVPGIGLQLAAHLLILMQETLDPRSLAAFIGICPIKHESGSSVYSAPTSRHFGPPKLRKLLYLAACSVRTHKSSFSNTFTAKSRMASTKNWSSTTSKTRSSRLLVLSSARNNPTFPTMLLSIPWFFKKP
ncbi:MAG: IS110 family transposase [Anaerolineae bacterium]|nr:IS110 family transposase [Anaerolineae bacterium]